MAPQQDDLNASPAARRLSIPRQRRSPEHNAVLDDDRLIEDIRHGRITDSSPVHPLVRMLARWRRQVMAGT